MTQNKARRAEPIAWLPAERLGQLSMDGHVRPWLIGKGLITSRMRAACGERFALHLAEQSTALLSQTQKAALRITDSAALFREVELCCDEKTWVFVQTVVPDSTLSLYPWIAELGEASLNETLGDLTGVERSAYEYARLPADDVLAARALKGAELKPSELWARRSRIALRGAPLLQQEVFLPALGSI